MSDATIQYSIDGMTCQACATRIEKVLSKQSGVIDASVNFASEQALIHYEADTTDLTSLQQAIQKAGFTATVQDKDALATPAQQQALPNRLKWLLVLCAPFMVGMVGMLMGKPSWMIPVWLQAVLATICQGWLGLPFYKGAWASLRHGMANMDTLVVLGTTSIYLYSLMAYIVSLGEAQSAPHVYFEASVMIFTFVSVGKYLEARSKRESLNSLGLMLEMTPQYVNVKDGEQFKKVKTKHIGVGDLIKANHGERIAADGIVIDGNAWCDESHLTGESKAVGKAIGDKVLAGAMVSKGSVIYRSEALGNDTLLGDMMLALSQAQGSKAPIARIADKVAAVFVPVVVAIALLTFSLTWWLGGDWVKALVNAVAVLVIACPCALGLATPAAIMVGMGKAVHHGIWFKNAQALEHCSAVDTVVFDKTGTLTLGKPSVQSIWRAPTTSIDEHSLFAITAGVEQYANHPIADALIDAAQQRDISPLTSTSADTIPGKGIQAHIPEFGLVKVGSPDYIGLTLDETFDALWHIATIVAVSINDEVVGAFALSDQIKDDSKQAVERLHQKHIQVYMMSGDNQAVADHIAKALNIDHAYGNMTPRDKSEAIERLQQQGKTVAMVGDGVNDAPALAVARVSFAIKGGTDIAEHTANATLMRQSADQVADALIIARATLRNIKQNLLFAFIYNVIGIPLAALGYLTPVLAAIAMALSSLSVIANALRLKWIVK